MQISGFDPGAWEYWVIVPFALSVSMNPKEMELSPKQTSAIQALTLNDMEEGMGQKVTRAWGLQEELAQRMALLSQESAEAQALQGKEAFLADITEEKMAHQIQVLVLAHIHIWHAEEIKAQSEEIKQLSTLLERQQTILEHVQEQQSSVTQMPHAQPPTYQLDELHKEAFNILPGTVNARCGTSIKHLSGLSQNIPVMGKAFLEDELAEETTWGSHHPCHVHFANGQKGVWHHLP